MARLKGVLVLIQAVVTVLALLPPTAAIVLLLNNTQSIRDAAATAAHGLLEIYKGNQTGQNPGKFPYPPYYWWESGGVWGGMINYAHYTGDHTYDNVTYNALLSQLGPAYDFVVPSEAFDEGNDDQAFWLFAAMSAAEYGFQDPPLPLPYWVQICDYAFNDYVTRWNTSTCAGGLQWQFHPENKGFTYKNAVSNGGFFQLAARLGRYTGNQTYFNWANKVWDWSSGVGLIDAKYNVYDGADDTINCTGINHDQWSYNVAVYLYGAAVMQNATNGSALWVQRTAGLLNAVSTFTSPFANATDILFEAECETKGVCDVDQYSFKAYLSRWLAETSLMAPFTAGRVGQIIRASALGAANACTGGPYGNTCGAKWYVNEYDGDGIAGLGQQLTAMEVFYALLVNDTTPPMTQTAVQIRAVPTAATTIIQPLAVASVTTTTTVSPSPTALSETSSVSSSTSEGVSTVPLTATFLGRLFSLLIALFIMT